MSTGFKLHAPYLGTDPLPEQFDPEEYLDVLHLETNAGNVIIQNPLDPEDTSVHTLDEYISDTPVSIGDEDELPDRLDHLWIKTVETDSTREILNAINSSGGFINRGVTFAGAESFFNVSTSDSPNIHSIPGLRNWFPSTVEPDLPALSLNNDVLNIPFALEYYDYNQGDKVLQRYNEQPYSRSSYFIYDINNQDMNDKLLYVYANHYIVVNPYTVDTYTGKPEMMLTIDGFISNGNQYHISEISNDVIEYGRFRADAEFIDKFGDITDSEGNILKIQNPLILLNGSESDWDKSKYNYVGAIYLKSITNGYLCYKYTNNNYILINPSTMEATSDENEATIKTNSRTSVGGTFLRINIPNINLYSEEDGNDGINVISFVGYNNWTGKRFIITTVFKLYYDSNNQLHTCGFNHIPGTTVSDIY